MLRLGALFVWGPCYVRGLAYVKGFELPGAISSNATLPTDLISYKKST